MGGCRCTWFHLYPERRELGARDFKRLLVEQGRSHAAVVFDGDVAVAWAQYGPVAELPNIHHRGLGFGPRAAIEAVGTVPACMN